MTMYATLITGAGRVYLHEDDDEGGRWRWLTEQGEDTETSGTTWEEGIRAGLMGWPEGVVLIVSDRLGTEDAAGLRGAVADWLTA